MRKWAPIAIVNVFLSVGTGLLAYLYRTGAVETGIISTWLPVLAGAATFAAIVTVVILRTILRELRALHRIEENLRQLNEKTPETILEAVRPVPVGKGCGTVQAGWNKLAAAIEDWRQHRELKAKEQNLGQFLCSYDSQRLLGLLDSMPEGIILAEADGTILLANRACEGLLERRLSEFIGQSVFELFQEDEAHNKLRMILGTEATYTENQFEMTVGQEPAATVLEVSAYRLARQGENSDILLTIKDISQQKISEASRDNFIAHVSHELRSPLTNIRAYTETLLSDMVLDAQTQKEAFNVINSETNRLIRLVNDVLDLSRLETGSLTLERAEVVTDRLVRQCVNDVKAAAVEKNITLQTNFHPKIPNLYADREKLAVVLNNILSNAIKYTPENGSVFVETNVDDNFVYIKVADTGYGIAPKDQAKIFEKFYRVDRKEIASIPGTGLGLATSREIVLLHGGDIEVTSEENSGSEFLIKLPITTSGPALGPGRKHTGLKAST